jgi:hypothetical protein
MLHPHWKAIVISQYVVGAALAAFVAAEILSLLAALVVLLIWLIIGWFIYTDITKEQDDESQEDA